MRKTIVQYVLTSVVLTALGAGCSFIARDTETYKQENRSLVETKTSDIKACYDTALTTNPGLKGEVAISYTIEKKTGKLTNMTVLTDKTTAPAELQNCIMSALEGLTFAKPDQRDGIVQSFTWSFKGQG
jgi:uncharacterized protein with FMN-binding domain